MDLELAKLICEQDYYDKLELRESYSGRGMYGKETAGVVIQEVNDFWVSAIKVVREMSSDDAQKAVDELESTQLDNMGMKFIVY